MLLKLWVPRCQYFLTIKCRNKVYTMYCTHSNDKRWEYCTPCFKKCFFFEDLYTTVHNGSTGTMRPKLKYFSFVNLI